MIDTEEQKQARWIEFASTFPSLNGRSEVASFDLEALDRWAAGGASHGEACAVRFVLRIWNQYAEWSCGPFDFFDAWNVWDQNHQTAFIVWCSKPFYL